MEDIYECNTVSLYNLPFEVLELILSFEDVNFLDVCHFSQVSHLCKEIGYSKELWRRKYRQRYKTVPVLTEGNKINWREEFISRYTFGKQVVQKLREMSQKFYHCDNVSNDAFAEFRGLLGENHLAQNMLIEELESVIHDGKGSDNLTQKYYAKQVLRFVKHLRLQEIWRDFLDKPPKNQSLEIGACLLSQWCQPTRLFCTESVQRRIDKISELVKLKVQEVCPKHPVVYHDFIPADCPLPQSLWNPSQCKIILNCINHVFYKDLQFWGNKTDYYCAENTYIDQVLKKKTGIPISLAIIYEGIAHRLGVLCLPVNFPGHFLLKWLEHPNLSDREAYTYIDVFDEGTFKNSHECCDLVSGYVPASDSWFEAVTPVKVFIRMCWNLVEYGRQLDGVGEGLFCLCSALELLSILNPDDLEHKLLLARVYLHLCINMTEVISLLQEVSSQDPASTGVVGYMYQAALSQLETQKRRSQTPKIVPKRREKDSPVKFAIGMIMKHMKYDYRCVIYGWDPTCTAGKVWMKQMGVNTLVNKDKQPFYNVLADDGTMRYAAQENLEIDLECKPISHMEVGRYFQSYRGSYYIPNEQKLAEYPDDTAARDSLFSFGAYFTYDDKSDFTEPVKDSQ